MLLDRTIIAVAEGKVGSWPLSLRNGQPSKVLPGFADDLRRVQAIDAHSLERWCDGLRAEEARDPEHERVYKFSDQIVCAPPPFVNSWIEYSACPVDATPEQYAEAHGDSYGLAIKAAWKRGSPGAVAGVLFYESKLHGIVEMGEGLVRLDANAKPDLTGFLTQYDPEFERRNPVFVDEFSRNFRWAVTVAMMAFQLMDCPKEHVPRELVRPSPGLARKWRRKHGRELVSYYTLDVGPSPEEAARAQRIMDDAEREGRAVPRLHWVRGHFKRGQYVTAERPQGRYCRPFLRGSMEAGLVLKDYNVRTPPPVPA